MTLPCPFRVTRKAAATLGPAGWLSLAAAPTFAIMALVTALGRGADPICSVVPGTFPPNGMTVMYLLMSGFHLPPWLRIVSASAGRSA